MVNFPPYIRLIVNNDSRTEGLSAPKRKGRGVRSKVREEKLPVDQKPLEDTVCLTRQENRRALESVPPTPQEAELALKELEQELAKADTRSLEEVHSNLDRRVILTLLAPLVTS